MFIAEEDTVKIVKEFKDFISRGNVVDLAVAVVMGAAFTAIVNSLVADLITPLLSLVTGGYDFSQLTLILGVDEHSARLAYGSFIAAIINFLAIALVVFIMVKVMNKVLRRKVAESEEAEKPCPYCQEKIPLAAVRCPRCTTVLSPEDVPEDLR
jgi:large conductance mechanosensitive channel